jgi:hypothetical protein
VKGQNGLKLGGETEENGEETELGDQQKVEGKINF